ncbi:hypothetical protein ACTXOJ_16865 [Glutamicibacter arilaitensis]|uniref:hypothetical protein n=1 Tax=Glutamicibacter arilaitensis TaxID=256701 RepID=UPI003FD18CE3
MNLKSLRTDQAFIRMADDIKEKCRGKKVVYVANVGNWGDGLIHKGNIQFLKYNDIEYRQMSRGTVEATVESLAKMSMRLEGVVLIAGGGGSWCDKWNGSRRFVEKVHRSFDSVIVLPTTYELSELKSATNITYYRRDKFLSAKSIPDSIFCHDAAFFLELDKKENNAVIESGNFFREDRERNPKARIFDDNLDLSLLANDTKPITPFFQILSNYQTIYTDRMHVAIAGSLLGRTVTLYPGSYAKSIDVYRSSIEPNYSSTKLGEW